MSESGLTRFLGGVLSPQSSGQDGAGRRDKCIRRLNALLPARMLLLASSKPVRLLLAFVAYYGTSCCIYGYLEEPGWAPIDSIYLATMVMSTVGYGDKHPDTAATRALTVVVAYLGFVLFFGLTWMYGLAFVPLLEKLRAKQEACNPPLQVKVTGVDGQSTVVRVPSPALAYYAQNLLPLLGVWIGVQFIFAALFVATEPDMPYALAYYHTILTAAGVGSEVQATTIAAKCVMVAQIIVSVGTLSVILQEAGWLATERRKTVERLQLMMRKSDPSLLQELHQSYVDAAEAFGCGKKPKHVKERRSEEERQRKSDSSAPKNTAGSVMSLFKGAKKLEVGSK